MARRLPIPNGRLDGALDANGQRIVNLVDPMSGDDAATKGYVDAEKARAEAAERELGLRLDGTPTLGETAGTAYPGNKGAANAADIANLKTSKQAALNAQQLAAVNSGATSEKLASMVTRDDVQPRGDGTEVIAVIGGKEIKAPAGGGGEGTVKSVNGVNPGANGDVKLDAGKIPVSSENQQPIASVLGGLDSLFEHVENKNNPHRVTADQVDGAVKTTDPRLTDARTPTKHAASHSTGGFDELAPSDIGAVEDGGKARGLRVGPVVLDGASLCLGYDTWGGEVPGSGSWNMIKRYTHPSGDVESLPEYLAANYAAADQLAPISAKVDAIEETVNVNNRILVSDDGVDARIQHADEVADGGWADDAVLVTQQRLDIGYPVNDDGMHPKNQSTQVVTTDGAVRIITLTQPEKVDGGTRDFVVYVNHTNPDAANDTYLLLGGDATFYYDGESGEAGFQKFITIPKGVMSAWYFTEIPGGNVWAVGKRALAKFTQGA